MVDTLITLYDSTETSFTTNGLGNMPDAISCIVTEERNGEFELEMEYPITGKRYSDLTMRRILLVKPNPYDNPQPFRIYAISKPIDGIVTFSAEHISYDLSGYPIPRFDAYSAQEVFETMKSTAPIECPFEFKTDISIDAEFISKVPTSIRGLLGGSNGNILDVYGGEYEFDKFTVMLHNNRGSDNGVSIRYGKNLTDLKQEENCSSVYTGVYPFWYSQNDGYVELEEKILYTEGTYNFTRIYPLDLSQSYSEKPTQSQLKALAEEWMKNNDIGTPNVSLKISFVQLSQSQEYELLGLLDTVRLCDTVNVEFPELNVSATSKCIKTKYDALTNKYKSIELGEAQSNIADTLISQNQAIAAQRQSIPSKSYIEQAIDNATQLITGGLGGFVVLHSSTDGDTPDEILIMDTDNIATATKVWRWNKNGLGYSSKGYNGPYTTAITQDGSIVADFITSGTMSANLIKGGTFVAGGKDNGNGVILVKDNNNNTVIKINNEGIRVFSDIMNLLLASGQVTFTNNDTGDIMTLQGHGLWMKNTGNTHYLSITQNRITLYSDTEKMTINLSSDGNILAIKITTDELIVKKDATIKGSLYIEDPNGVYAPIQIDMKSPAYFTKGIVTDAETRTGYLTVHNDATVYGTLYTASGTVSVSDRTVKDNIETLNIDNVADFIYRLKPSSYTYKDCLSGRKHHGFIAQDVKTAMGDDDWGLYIDGEVNAVKDETIKMSKTPKIKGLRYEELIADLVATAQSLNNRINILEGKLNEKLHTRT